MVRITNCHAEVVGLGVRGDGNEDDKGGGLRISTELPLLLFFVDLGDNLGKFSNRIFCWECRLMSPRSAAAAAVV